MSRIHEALKRAEEESKTKSPLAVAGITDESFLDAVTPVDDVQPVLPSEAESDRFREGKFEEDWLSKIAPSEWKPDSDKLVFSDPNRHYERGMEEFRTLRSRLYQLREKLSLKTLMIASALPGEGKTFVSSNLAYALVRQHGRRVLMIDADVRKPHMHECIGTSSTPGLNDYLLGKAEAKAILQRGAIENLFLIPGGEVVTNPAELIANGRFKRLLDELKPLFDWILVDSPPVIPISDGSVIARWLDGVLLVVRVEETAVELLQQAKQELRNRPLLGVVLNRAIETSKKSAYYYPYQTAATR